MQALAWVGERENYRILLHRDAPLPSFSIGHATSERTAQRCDRRRPQVRDHAQDAGEEVSRDGHLRHLEGDIAAMADEPGADLDQLLAQRRHRPVADRLRRRQRAHEVAGIVGERVKLEANRVGGEGAAGKPRPFDRALALLDPLLARAALVVEGGDILGVPRHVGEMKPTRG